MNNGRRRFLKTTALTTAAVGAASLGSPFINRVWAANRSLKVLILGGTGQTGPHLVHGLVACGHTVTLCNRGNRSGEMFPDLECIVADRDVTKPEGLDALKAEIDSGRTWDVCIDIWPHIPLIVETTGYLLKNNIKHFMYVSSLSAYADHSQPNMDETAPASDAPDADTTEFNMGLFGPFKGECEKRVRQMYPDNHTIYRPGLIVGPRDFSFRGVYWPVRVERGGEILAPGSGYDRIQVIDARDLTDFQIRCMESGTAGTFNVIGPHPKTPLNMRRLLETCQQVSGSDAQFVWASNGFLEQHEVGAWMDMPCWIPAEGEYAGFGSRSNTKAIAAGLQFRRLAVTVQDTLDWYHGLDEEQQGRINGRAGLTAEREAEVLAAWHEARG
jgi:2'-hydroxyisoflavone reductase